VSTPRRRLSIKLMVVIGIAWISDTDSDMVSGRISPCTNVSRGYSLTQIRRALIAARCAHHATVVRSNVADSSPDPSPFPHGVSFKPGHVTTVEPGYYREGEWGIRTESVVLCKELEVGWVGSRHELSWSFAFPPFS
jgi:hypothetical protein